MAQVRTVFFFRGGKYVRYEIDPVTGAETVNHDFYPRAVAEAWTAMPAEFTQGFDAVVNWPDGFVYFFKGSRYVRYDIETDHVDHGIYPRDIAEGGPDFPAAFTSGVDAAVNWGNGTAYFFKAGSYLNYDIKNEKVRPGYPLPITEPGKWPELVRAGFAGPVGEAIEWPQADVASADIPARLVSCSKRTQPDVRCGGEFDMHTVFTNANPSIPACGEYRQYIRGELEVNGQPVRFITKENGVPTPRLMRSRPDPGATDDHFIEDGQAASNPANPFHVDLDYGHRHASIGNGNRNDMYLLQRRSGAEYIGRSCPPASGP